MLKSQVKKRDQHVLTVLLTALVGAALFLMASFSSGHAQTVEELPPSEGMSKVLDVIDRDPYKSVAALEVIAERGKPDVSHALIELMRFFPFLQEELIAALVAITGDNPGEELSDWVLWSQKNGDIESFPDYDRFKGDLYANIDQDFRLFLNPGVKHTIRLEDVTWGGVAKDGIPSLDNPTHVTPAEATYITPDELVFGVEINGDARAYPLRIMDWHEMFNDVVGDVPVALAYCTLCASGILFETDVEGQPEPFSFGSSGFLYQSNKLMYDRQTLTMWNQFTGKPVVGDLVGSDVRLKARPVAITRWADWFAAHPDTKVLSIETGFDREYTPGKPYGDYFNSPDLMFPVNFEDASRPPKSYVYAVRLLDDQKAWPLDAFTDMPVINDEMGGEAVVLIGEVQSRTVRAYRRGDNTFDKPSGTSEAPRLLDTSGAAWTVTEDALEGPDGAVLERLPGHIGYWFAFRQYYPDAAVYGG